MKQFYTFILATLFTLTSYSQSYQFGIISNGGYNFSIIATPDYDVTDSDISDIGFALMLPAGDADVTNITDFNGRVWSSTQVTEAQFTGAGLNSNDRDGFVMNLPPGQTVLSHTSGTSFVLISFDISNMPMSGDIEILTNTDPIAIGLGGAVDSFYNSNIDETTTQDYFNGLISGQESFSFETLSTSEIELEEINLSVYPNPSIDMLHVSTNLEVKQLILYDILGKQVVKVKDTKSFTVSQLNAGNYILKIVTNVGTLSKKVIIE